MSEQRPTIADTLYLDAEHFILTTESRLPLEPRERVVPIGRARFELNLREEEAGPDEEEPA